jgi:outer membrane protein OmpA-like peptidoglycan-associated protein
MRKKQQIVGSCDYSLNKTSLYSLVCLCLALVVPDQGRALNLALPFSNQTTTQVVTAPDSHALAIGVFADGKLPVKVLEGQVERQVLRLPGQALTTLQMLVPLREQLTEIGFEILLDCFAATCGGFDFRFATEVLPAPDMYVDLNDFRYLSAQLGAQDHIGLLVSSGANAGFIQIIRVSSGEDALALRVTGPGDLPVDRVAPEPAPDTGEQSATSPVATRPSEPLSLADSLQQRGHVILSDLTFDTGSSQLAQQRFGTLESLAEFLLADSTRRVALVGHTDAVGGLPGNITLSRQRARSVQQRLIEDYGVPESQLAAEGMGYLSPIAPNTSSAGREINRRVEAVLLNTE